MKIQLGNETIECNVQYGKRKKSSIQIDPWGRVTVKVPKDMSEEMVVRAVEHHGPWVLVKLRQMAKAREAQPAMAKAYQEQEKFLYLGKEYALNELIDTDGFNEDELRRNLKRFYFASCKKIVGERVLLYQNQLKVRPKSVEVVESSINWGSCSSDRRITFNYRLAMAPLEVIDYVVIHELCHLLHMNHDRSFWRRVGSIMPDYKDKQAFLARFGHAMTL